MKYAIAILSLVLLNGCIITGEGKFTGRIVDVEWGGIIFKSCDVTFQLGEQSSTTSKGSTASKEKCDELSKAIGLVTTVAYRTHLIHSIALDSKYELIDGVTK